MDTQESSPRKGLSTNEAAMALKQLRERSAEPAQEEVTEEADPQNQAESAEIEAEADTETETPEVEEDQTEADVEEEAEPSDADVYQVGDVEFTMTELREWRDNGLKNKDYTEKTQALSSEKTALATDRQQFEVERSQVTEALKAQQLQLQESLAAFAIEQDPRPSPEGKSWEQHSTEIAEWETREARRNQARQAHGALQHQQRQETVNRELQSLLMKRPDWRDETVWAERMGQAREVGVEYGISPEEFETMTDHRVFLALNDLHALRQGMNTQQAKETAAAKKVVKAVKKLAPGAKSEQKAGVAKQAQEAKARAKKSGKPKDVLQALRAKRQAGV